MEGSSVCRPIDVRHITAIRRVRLHPNGTIGAVIATHAAGRRLYRHERIWLRVDGESGRISADRPLAGVTDFGWSSSGDRYYMVARRKRSLELSLGRWGGVGQEHREAALPLRGEPDRISWSRDGQRMVFAVKVRPESDPDDPGHVWLRGIHPFKREPNGFHDGTFRQIFVGECSDGKSWTFRQVTRDPIDHSMPAMAPDGRTVVYVRSAPGVDGFEGKDLIIRHDLTTGEETIVVQIGGPSWFPTWDSSGNRLAWLGHDGRMGPTDATDIRLFVLNLETGVRTELSTGFGRGIEDVIVDDVTHAPGGPSPIVWIDDDRAVLALATDGGTTSIWRLDASQAPDAPSRIVSAVSGPRRVFAFDASGGRILLAYAAPDDPGRVSIVSSDRELVVFDPNQRWLSKKEITKPMPFDFQGARGEQIEGWIMPPIGRPLDNAPCIIQINRGRFGCSFYFEAQCLAAAGFTVAYINPHGSYGYGEVFKASTHYDPATLEVEDVIHALDRLGSMNIDMRRVGISGWSFGGFLVNWLVTHFPDRFAAAVTQASYCNRHSLWGTSSIGPSRWDRPGPPWKHAEFLLSRSPLTHVEHVRIPMLLIHGDRDTICPLEQAEQWYTALAMRGLNPTFLVLKGEGHDLARNARPESRILRMSSIVEWFREHLQENHGVGVSAGSQ